MCLSGNVEDEAAMSSGSSEELPNSCRDRPGCSKQPPRSPQCSVSTAAAPVRDVDQPCGTATMPGMATGDQDPAAQHPQSQHTGVEQSQVRCNDGPRACKHGPADRAAFDAPHAALNMDPAPARGQESIQDLDRDVADEDCSVTAGVPEGIATSLASAASEARPSGQNSQQLDLAHAGFEQTADGAASNDNENASARTLYLAASNLPPGSMAQLRLLCKQLGRAELQKAFTKNTTHVITEVNAGHQSLEQ